jgi:hypothetical protein
MNVTIIACFSLIITGAFKDLDEMAWLIATHLPEVTCTLTEYPVGWRCQVSGDGDHYQKAFNLVEQRIAVGVQVTIANSAPMATRVYRAEQNTSA